MSKSYFVAGAMIQKDKNKPATFELIKPSSSTNPYITHNMKSNAMRLCGQTAALYYYNPTKGLLQKMDDVHYELDGKYQPLIVDLTDMLRYQIEKAIKDGDILLTY